MHGFSPSTTLTGRAKSTTSPSTDLIYTAGETGIGVPTRLYTHLMHHFQIPPNLSEKQSPNALTNLIHEILSWGRHCLNDLIRLVETYPADSWCHWRENDHFRDRSKQQGQQINANLCTLDSAAAFEKNTVNSNRNSSRCNSNWIA